MCIAVTTGDPVVLVDARVMVSIAGALTVSAVLGPATVTVVRGLTAMATVWLRPLVEVVPEPVVPAAVAVTVAARTVDKVVVAVPVASVNTDAEASVPAVVEKATDTPARPRPDASCTLAAMAEVPPVAGRLCGVAVTTSTAQRRPRR